MGDEGRGWGVWLSSEKAPRATPAAGGTVGQPASASKLQAWPPRTWQTPEPPRLCRAGGHLHLAGFPEMGFYAPESLLLELWPAHSFLSALLPSSSTSVPVNHISAV